MLSTKSKIGMLVAGHVVAGLILTWAAIDKKWPSPDEVAQAALIFADAGLLGIWGALGATRRRWRWAMVLWGTAYLVVTVFVGEYRLVQVNAEALLGIIIMIGLPTVVILVVLSVLRHSRKQLHVVCSLHAGVPSEGLQFTIRHLLVTTAVAAVVLAVGQNIPEFNRNVATFVVLCPCLVMVELAVLWGAIGIGRPAPRLLVVLPTAFVVGLVPPFYLKSMIPQEWTSFIAWSFITGLQAAITAGSLLVIRSCGYRLVGQGADRSNLSPIEVVST